MIFVQEVYFGKSPILLEIERLMDEYRNKYMNRYNVPLGCNSDPLLLKINRLFEEQFGFGCFSLMVLNVPMQNAMTLPIDYTFDVINPNKNLVADKKGFKFNKDAGYSCIIYIYSGIIFNPAYTTEEVMACIMHEIGHNFYGAMSITNTVMVDIYSAFYQINLFLRTITGLLHPVDYVKNVIFSTNVARRISIEMDRFFLKNMPFVYKIQEFYLGAINVTKTIKGSIIKLIDLITLGALQPILSLSNISFPSIFSPMKYNNERTADNFATMFGYGSATISLQTKLQSHNITPSKIQKYYNEIPIISNIYALNCDIALLLLTLFDEHPVAISRCKDQIDLLERDLSKQDIDPKMKKVIKSDLKKCNTELEKIIDTQGGIKNKDMLKHFYYKALYENTDSKDLKDALFNDINRFDQYDKTYAQKGGNN